MLSRIPIPCPECRQTLRVRPEYIGQRVQCNRCGHPFPVPRALAVACPGCGQRETFRAEDLGRVVQCNRCYSVHEALAVDGIECAPTPGTAGSGTGEPSEPSQPLQKDVRPPDVVVRVRAEPGDEGRSARLAAFPEEQERRSFSNVASPTAEIASAGGREPGRIGEAVRARPVGADPADDGGLSLAAGAAAPELASRGAMSNGGPDDQPSELEQLRAEADSLRIRTSEAERLRAECEALKDQAKEREGCEEALRIQLEEFRSQLRRLESEVAASRDGATSAQRLEDELRAAGEEVERLRADCQESRAAAAAATREVETLRAHSSALQEGFYQALAEIEAHSSERLVSAREAERLRARLGELEGQVAEAVAARRAVEDDAARALRARESELAALRDELRTLQTQMQELAELEAEEERLLAIAARERIDRDEGSAREVEHLRARLGELEGQVAEAMAARTAAEEDAARALRARESELAALREELRTLQTQMQELAELEAEEERLLAIVAREHIEHDEVSAELAAFLSSPARRPVRREAGSTSPGPHLSEVVRMQGEPVATSQAPARRMGKSESVSAPRSPAVVSAPHVDFALERIDLREALPPRDDFPAAQLPGPVPEAPGPPIVPVVANGPIAGRGTPEPTESAAGPPIQSESPEVQAHRLRHEILGLMSQGRKKEAESLSRRLVELIRTVAGELSDDFSTWMTVVGQLQAEQGDLAGARSTFDRKNAIFRDRLGERDPRYLTCVANSAEALLVCGDFAGARALFEEVEANLGTTFDSTHPFPIAIRQRLDGLRDCKSDLWTVRVAT